MCVYILRTTYGIRVYKWDKMYLLLVLRLSYLAKKWRTQIFGRNEMSWRYVIFLIAESVLVCFVRKGNDPVLLEDGSIVVCAGLVSVAIHCMLLVYLSSHVVRFRRGILNLVRLAALRLRVATFLSM